MGYWYWYWYLYWLCRRGGVPIDGVGVLNFWTIWPANTTNPSFHLPSHLVTSSTIYHYSVLDGFADKETREFAFISFSGTFSLSYHYFSLFKARSSLVHGSQRPARTEASHPLLASGSRPPPPPPSRSWPPPPPPSPLLASAQPAANFPLVATHSLSLARFILSSPPFLSFDGHIV